MWVLRILQYDMHILIHMHTQSFTDTNVPSHYKEKLQAYFPERAPHALMISTNDVPRRSNETYIEGKRS